MIANDGFELREARLERRARTRQRERALGPSEAEAQLGPRQSPPPGLAGVVLPVPEPVLEAIDRSAGIAAGQRGIARVSRIRTFRTRPRCALERSDRARSVVELEREESGLRPALDDRPRE